MTWDEAWQTVESLPREVLRERLAEAYTARYHLVWYAGCWYAPHPDSPGHCLWEPLGQWDSAMQLAWDLHIDLSPPCPTAHGTLHGTVTIIHEGGIYELRCDTQDEARLGICQLALCAAMAEGAKQAEDVSHG